VDTLLFSGQVRKTGSTDNIVPGLVIGQGPKGNQAKFSGTYHENFLQPFVAGIG